LLSEVKWTSRFDSAMSVNGAKLTPSESWCSKQLALGPFGIALTRSRSAA